MPTSPGCSLLICNAPEGRTTTRESPGTGTRSCWFFCQCIAGIGSPMTSHFSNTVSPMKAVTDSVWDKNLRGPRGKNREGRIHLSEEAR